MTPLLIDSIANCGTTYKICIMKKIFHFDSPTEQYVADAAVLCCFDHRINRAVRKFLKKEGIEHVDMIVVAGGAKTLASPRNDFEQDFILEQVRMSIRLHKTERVIVMSHSDCATYGGLAQFKGDKAAEAEHHRSELLRAAELLTTHFPDISVEPYFVKFDGIWEVKGAGSLKSTGNKTAKIVATA
jgi:carbonic anhydrase